MQFPYPHIDYSPRLGPFLLGPNTEPENGVYGGDFFSYAHLIPDNSIDLCFTDPVYWQIDDYRRLAEVCSRVLKPDSALLTFCAIGHIPETHDALRKGGLSYRWRLIVRPVNAKEFNGRLLITSQECLWYEKGNSNLYTSLFDVQMSTRKGVLKKNGSNWGKGGDALARFLLAFTRPGNLVLNPFCGSGELETVCKQLNRRYLAFEIDKPTAHRARQRVRDTQPPLFVLQPEQTRLPDPEIA